jgi:DNA repair exonuclease SbcCD ATPase subunit
MKIKSISINGIRGFGYWKTDSDNGDSTPHNIQVEQKHFFLYGENGTGKSSFFDALEWGITGEIPESKNRKIEEEKTFLRHADCPTDAESAVKVILQNGKGASQTIHRTFTKKSTQTPTELDVSLAYQHFIEARRIESFVVDTNVSLWKRFMKLLGFEELIEFDDQYTALKNHAQRECERLKEEVSKKERTHKQKLEIVQNYQQTLRHKLGNGWEQHIEENGQIHEDNAKKLQTMIVLHDNMNRYIQTHADWQKSKLELNVTRKHLQEVQSQQQNAESAAIVEEAYQYFTQHLESKECPACGSILPETTKVIQRLEILRESLAKIATLQKSLEQQSHEYTRQEKWLQQGMERIAGEYVSVVNENLSTSDINSFVKQLQSQLEIVNEQKEQLQKKTNVENNQLIGRYDAERTALQAAEKEMTECQAELRISEQISNDTAASYELYVQEYHSHIQHSLNMIADEFVTTIYNKINQTDNEVIEKFNIESSIDKKEVFFRAKRKGSEELVDAVTILSTGHLRCLGFALLITQIVRRATSSPFNFIAIDDPIYAIDHEHRYYLVHYLKELGQKFQLIIASSDRNFFDILRHTFESQRFNAYEMRLNGVFGSTALQLSPSVKANKISNHYIDQSNEHCDNGDLRAAALYARLALETKLFHTAEHYKVPIKTTYDRIKRVGIKDFFEEIELQQGLKKKYPSEEARIEEEFKKLEQHRYFRSLVHGFPGDEELHFINPERRLLHKQEITDIIETIRAFCTFIDKLKS